MLEIRNLSLAYGKTRVLQNVSLPAVSDGALVGVLGPNGAGKSTFLRAVAGQSTYSGSILFEGREVSRLPHRERTLHIGFMPQSPPNTSGFVAYELVVSSCRSARPDLTATEVANSAEAVFGYLQLQELAFRPLSRMSGGQRQLVGLAQILVRDPKVLLLDEPSSALDLKWQVTVFEILRKRLVERGGLCLVALHDLNLAIRYCDLVAIMRGGRCIAYGPPAQALTPTVLRDAYDVSGRVETCSRGQPIVIVDGGEDVALETQTLIRKVSGEP